MKKTLLYLFLAVGLVGCAKELVPVSEEKETGKPMTFEINVQQTKVEKTLWADGDVIYVFFKGLEDKFLVLTYDGSSWTNAAGDEAFVDTDFSALSTKTLAAVHLPVPVDVAFADGTFSFTKDGAPVYNYYLSQAGVKYTVDGTTVRASLALAKPDGFAQFHVAGIQKGADDYCFSSSEIQPVACAGVSVDGSVVEKAKAAGDLLWGVADADGLVFGGRLENPGATAEYKFVLTGPDKIFKLEREKVLSAGARYNFPAPLDPVGWIPVTENPGYDFLHLSNYTFNVQEAVTDLVRKLEFDGNDGSILWWTQVNPDYYTSRDAGTEPNERKSNRFACADYDAHNLNLAELAFNVVKANDEIMDAYEMKAANLSVEFSYADPAQGSKLLPELSRTDSFQKYDDLWIDETTFYYRTNEKKFIRMVGKLFITAEGEKYELPTRFSRPKASVAHPEVVLDYSRFALVPWTPFQFFESETATMRGIDGNSMSLFTNLSIKDQRPMFGKYYLFKDSSWVIGNASADATSSSGTNGFIEGVSAKQAYGLPDLTYTVELPAALDGIWTVRTEESGPYLHYDSKGALVAKGEYAVFVTVTMRSPWQEPIVAKYTHKVKVE